MSAKITPSPICMTAGHEGIISSMNQAMVSSILANNERVRRIFGMVMDYCAYRKRMFKGFFGNKNMFKYISITIRSWMISYHNFQISCRGYRFSPIPTGILIPRLLILSKMMISYKSVRLSFYDSTSSMVIGSNIRFLTTSTLAQTFFNHIYLQIKRPISRLMRVVVLKPLLTVLSTLVFKYKKTTSRINYYYKIEELICQVEADSLTGYPALAKWPRKDTLKD